ncbi:methyltransferase [Croceivirga lutea]|uniref:16S rRNA (guanine(966)-N(2))-methyltransferase RsmD n=1 Tax=Croceivirga lutea TaxID=1775167 RepID=UPI00163AB111|nr:16S rRNA (guanine(966)-N(2))-methyltransferase RsmD [Croceivirga lutea]GGG56983.1 methyltransferase [Croceivirga lutea]
MRIISGRYRGKRLIAPKKLPVRPTTDMAKESLFNILNNQFYIEDIKVLDLFAGTGNISFEFASRGANSITAVDSHAGCIKYISKINEELDFNIDIIKSDVFQYLKRTVEKFDVIFADPPYNLDLEKFQQIPALVFTNTLLQEDGLLIIEHSPQTNLSDLPNFKEQRKYGSSVFSFFQN